eukprot:jgi/Tetstr1/464346/TSEL_009141.t1
MPPCATELEPLPLPEGLSALEEAGAANVGGQSAWQHPPGLDWPPTAAEPGAVGFGDGPAASGVFQHDVAHGASR